MQKASIRHFAKNILFQIASHADDKPRHNPDDVQHLQELKPIDLQLYHPNFDSNVDEPQSEERKLSLLREAQKLANLYCNRTNDQS